MRTRRLVTQGTLGRVHAMALVTRGVLDIAEAIRRARTGTACITMTSSGVASIRFEGNA